MQKILAKLHKVMQDVQYIQKDSENPSHHYSYASELVIKKRLSKAFRDHKIIFQLNSTDMSVTDALGKDYKGNEIKATILKCNYVFYDVDSGEKLTGEFMASGPARDDKGLWAATTNAIKYILTSTFLIPTGDDAESDKNHPPEERETKKATSKKSTGKKNPPPEPQKEKESDGEIVDHRAIFVVAYEKRCEEQKIDHKGITKKIKDKIFKAIWQDPAQLDICMKTGYQAPAEGMSEKNTGWLVLAQIVATFDIQAIVLTELQKEMNK